MLLSAFRSGHCVVLSGDGSSVTSFSSPCCSIDEEEIGICVRLYHQMQSMYMYTLYIFKLAPAKCQQPLLSFHLTCLLILLLVCCPRFIASWSHQRTWVMSCNAHAVAETHGRVWAALRVRVTRRVASRQSMCARGCFPFINRYRRAFACHACVHHTDTVKQSPWIGGEGSAS